METLFKDIRPRVMTGLLLAAAPTDLMTFAIVSARRATKVDPSVVLRYE